MTQKLKQDDVARIAEADSVRQTVFFRDPDRANPSFTRSRRRVPEEVKRAQGRLRTARWRSSMDSRKAPTAQQVGLALAVALATSKLRDLTTDDRSLVEKALHFLAANGFSVDEARMTMKRLRRKLVDPMDRDEGEATESCAPALRPSSWGPEDDVEALF